MLCQLDDWLQEQSSLLIFIFFLINCIKIWLLWFVYKVLKECKLWYTVVEVYFILLIFTVTKTDYLTNCWIYDMFLVLSSVDGYFQGSANFRPLFSQCDTCLLCLKLPYNVYTYTSNCWINRSINITLEPHSIYNTDHLCRVILYLTSF